MLHDVKTLCNYVNIITYDVKTLCNYVNIITHDVMTLCTYVNIITHNVKTLCTYVNIMLHYALSPYRNAITCSFCAQKDDFFDLSRITKEALEVI